jgi:type IV secretory pathway TraG/TraD family ATPase VirD4
MARLLALFTVALASLSVATQSVAAALDCAPALGSPRVRLGATSVYAPWAWVTWSIRFERYAPDAFRTVSAQTTAGAVPEASSSQHCSVQRDDAVRSARFMAARAERPLRRCAPRASLQNAGVVLGQTHVAGPPRSTSAWPIS